MASITREQALKLDKQAPGSWRFDLQHYVIWSEKQIVRWLDLDDTRKLSATITFRENAREPYRFSGDGTYRINLILQIYEPTGTGMLKSEGFGKWIDLDNGRHPRRNYKDLCKIAESITDEDLLKYIA